jgi:hypothetical protein
MSAEASTEKKAESSPGDYTLSVDDLQSPTRKYTTKRMSLSFTSPPSDSSGKTFDGATPSPRHASLSFSSNNTCPLDYSTDNEVDSLTLLPISPVSPCDDEKDGYHDGNCSFDPCNSHLKCQESLIDVCTVTVYDRDTNTPKNDETNGKDRQQTELIENSQNAIYDLQEFQVEDQVPSEVSTLDRSSDCNKRNSNGQSPLSISSSNCFLRGMMLLIEKGADVNLTDSFGRTPLHLACENTESNEHHDCISYLLAHGADLSIQGRSLILS